MPDSASFCSSKNSSQLGYKMPATPAHTHVGRVGCSFSARDRSRTPQRQATAIPPRDASRPAATSDLLRHQHGPSGAQTHPIWVEGLFSLLQEALTLLQASHRNRQERAGAALSLPAFPSPGCLPTPAAPAPTSLAHTRGACRQEIVLIFFFLYCVLFGKH